MAQGRIGRRLALASLLAWSACAGGSDGADASQAVDAVDAVEAAPELPLDVPGDEVAPIPRWCPPQGTPAAPADLLPEPWRFEALGEALAVAAISVEGADDAMLAEVKALATRAGVPFQDAGGWTVRMQDAGTWAAREATCASLSDLSAGGYYLRTGTDGAVVYAPDAEGRRNALKTLKQLVAGPGSVRAMGVFDRPSNARRGVVESYYGDPWDPDTRTRMLALEADLKFNYHVYAPKFDLLIDSAWRVPFSQDNLDQLHAFAVAAKANGLHPCLQLHPSSTVVFSRPSDFDDLMVKYQAAAGQGIEGFGLAFDDTQAQLAPEDVDLYPDWVHAQVEWANKVGAALRKAYPDALLAFVPNDYWSGAPGVATDLAYVGANLDPLWEIAWTGPEVGSKSITAADADAIAKVLKRKPFLADNHPVVDNSFYSGVVNLGALEDRAPDLSTHVTAMVYNPMPLAYVSLPGLATAADYAWNGGAYDPARSLKAAAAWLVGAGAADAVGILAAADQSPWKYSSAAPELEAEIAAYRAAADAAARKVASDALHARLAGYQGVPAGMALATGGVPAFVDQAKPWSDKLGAFGDAGLIALALLDAKAAGQAVDAAALADLQTRTDALSQQRPKPTGTVMPDFLSQAITTLEGP